MKTSACKTSLPPSYIKYVKANVVDLTPENYIKKLDSSKFTLIRFSVPWIESPSTKAWVELGELLEKVQESEAKEKGKGTKDDKKNGSQTYFEKFGRELQVAQVDCSKYKDFCQSSNYPFKVSGKPNNLGYPKMKIFKKQTFIKNFDQTKTKEIIEEIVRKINKIYEQFLKDESAKKVSNVIYNLVKILKFREVNLFLYTFSKKSCAKRTCEEISNQIKFLKEFSEKQFEEHERLVIAEINLDVVSGKDVKKLKKYLPEEVFGDLPKLVFAGRDGSDAVVYKGANKSVNWVEFIDDLLLVQAKNLRDRSEL